MKKLITLLFVFLLVTTLAVSAAAAEVLPYLVDEADLLTPAQEAELEEKLEDLSEKWDMDIVVVTADDLDGASSLEFRDFYRLLLGEPQLQSYAEFFAPVFVMNALHRSLETGLEEPVAGL